MISKQDSQYRTQKMTPVSKLNNMKTYIIFIAVLSLTTNAFCQRNPLDISKVRLYLKASSTKSVSLFSTMNNVESVLGKPLKKYTHYSEIRESDLNVYEYSGKTQLYFYNDSLVALSMPEYEQSVITIGTIDKPMLTNFDFTELYYDGRYQQSSPFSTNDAITFNLRSGSIYLDKYLTIHYKKEGVRPTKYFPKAIWVGDY